MVLSFQNSTSHHPKYVLPASFLCSIEIRLMKVRFIGRIMAVTILFPIEMHLPSGCLYAS
jgi:hypothetical protein